MAGETLKADAGLVVKVGGAEVYLVWQVAAGFHPATAVGRAPIYQEMPWAEI